MLVTERVLNSNVAVIVFGLLGAVFGLMETVGKMMALTEHRIDSVMEKIENFKKMPKVDENLLRLRQNFSFPVEENNRKIYFEVANIAPTNMCELDVTEQNA